MRPTGSSRLACFAGRPRAGRLLVTVSILLTLLAAWPIMGMGMAERSCAGAIPGTELIQAECAHSSRFISCYLGGPQVWNVTGEYGAYEVTVQANIELKHGGTALDSYSGWTFYAHKVKSRGRHPDGSLAGVSYDPAAQVVVRTERQMREFFTPARKAEPMPDAVGP